MGGSYFEEKIKCLDDRRAIILRIMLFPVHVRHLITFLCVLVNAFNISLLLLITIFKLLVSYNSYYSTIKLPATRRRFVIERCWDVNNVVIYIITLETKRCVLTDNAQRRVYLRDSKRAVYEARKNSNFSLTFHKLQIIFKFDNIGKVKSLYDLKHRMTFIINRLFIALLI